jgi:fucose permease
VLPLFFCAFACFGAGLVLVGANQASLAASLSLDLAASGLLASTLALGLGVGVVVAGPLFDRHPRRPLFVAALLWTGLCLIGVEDDMRYARWLAHCAAVGFGMGVYDTLINALVAQRHGDRAARPMLVVHSGATLGAMLGAPLVGWIASRGAFTVSFEALGWAHLGMAAWAAATPLPAPEDRGASGRTRAALRAGAGSLLLLSAVAFAYVGVEAAVTVFAIPYVHDALALPVSRGQLGISAFWLGLLVGRLGLLALPGELGARVLRVSGAGAAAVLVALVAWPVAPPEVSLFALGVTLGSVYPLMITLAGQRFPEARGTAAGLVAGAGALGGFAVPWLSGALGDAAGIAAGFGSLALWCAAIALATTALRAVRGSASRPGGV